MKRVERLTGIITFLQSRNYTPIDRMVEKFEVSERTIYRDLVSLHEIGVPITYEKERGYCILDAHFIPPVSFSEEEAVALTLAGRLMRRFSDHKTNVHFDNALDKIKYALNSRQKEIVENITDTLTFPALESKSKNENPLFAVQDAIIRKRILRITYKNRLDEISERDRAHRTNFLWEPVAHHCILLEKRIIQGFYYIEHSKVKLHSIFISKRRSHYIE